MPLPVWPSSLPPFRGFAASAGSPGMFPGASVSSFDAGNRRMRRKVLGRPPTPLNMELELSFATLPIFDNFVEFDLNMGTLPFEAGRADVLARV